MMKKIHKKTKASSCMLTQTPKMVVEDEAVVDLEEAVEGLVTNPEITVTN